MSTTSSAELIATYESFILGGRATYAIAALVVFEHLITFKYEIDLLLRRKWSAATWIFVTNRYFLLANILFAIAPGVAQVRTKPTTSSKVLLLLCIDVSEHPKAKFVSQTNLSCNDSRAMNVLHLLCSGEISILPAHAFTLLRTFALLQDHPWRHAIVCTLIVLIFTSVTLVSYVDLTQTWIYIDDSILGSSCDQTGYTGSQGIINWVNMVSSVTAIISALSVLVITLMKTALQVRQATIIGLRTTLSEVLLRDGSLFFLVVLVQGIISAIPTFNESVLGGTAGYALTPSLTVLPPILLSRFIINLRQVDLPDAKTSSHQRSSHFSVPNFRRPTMDEIIGNLGEPLDFVEYHLGDEDDEQDDGANASESAEQQGVVGTPWATGVADVEAAGPSGSDSGGGADALDIDGIGPEALRLSPTLPVRARAATLPCAEAPTSLDRL